MNLDFDVPVQFWVLFLGWSFTLYLQHRSNRRTEALKRKDKLIDKIEDLIEWVQDETKKVKFTASDAEICYTSFLTQIELRTHQFNTHVKSNVLSVKFLSQLREIDFFASSGLDRYPFTVRDIAFEFIDHVEMACNDLYFGGAPLAKRINQYFNKFVPELTGVAFALLSLILLVFLFKLAFIFISM